MDRLVTFVCLFLLFNFNVSSVLCVNENNVDLSKSYLVNAAKYLDINKASEIIVTNQSDIYSDDESVARSKYDTDVGRTFGRPFKKMMSALLPLVFQIGAASTWAVIAAIVGVKTLFVALVILKLLLVAGAAKMGALFAHKAPEHHGWQPPAQQKEIHLHIHNGHGGESHQTGYDDHIVARRTFGRPFKKMMSALLPLVFQIGAASTWAVIAAIVGVKTLFVALVILKLLLVAGAAKMGALFAHKAPEHHGWQPPAQQKEIHLHIHNGHGGESHQTGYDDHIVAPPWSRDGAVVKPEPLDPYSAGPQTISTPFGNYVKINS